MEVQVLSWAQKRNSKSALWHSLNFCEPRRCRVATARWGREHLVDCEQCGAICLVTCDQHLFEKTQRVYRNCKFQVRGILFVSTVKALIHQRVFPLLLPH